MKREYILFLSLELLSLLLIYLGFKTSGEISIALGVGGLLLMVSVAWYFSERKRAL
ncbi:MAG: hypothetical protein JZD40_02810 [Sulfolobus sp.]|nr:hypothetical protein [Sulfolobus sp.]